MQLTNAQKATRHMATEVEYINRLLETRDLSTAAAKLKLRDAVVATYQAIQDDTLTIKFGVHNGRAWFNVL